MPKDPSEILVKKEKPKEKEAEEVPKVEGVAGEVAKEEVAAVEELIKQEEQLKDKALLL